MKRVFAIAVLLVGIALQSGAAVDVAATVKQQRDLRLAKPTAGAGFTATVGHLRLELTSGSVSMLMAGEEPVGLFLEGSGTFKYVTENRDEISALRYNAKNGGVDVQLTEASGTVAGGFRSVLLRGNGLPAVTGSEAAIPESAFKTNRELFARQQSAMPSEYLFVMQKANAPSARLVQAEIQGTDRAYVYEYDDVWRHDETFSALRSPEVRGHGNSSWLYETPLSTQAIGRSNRTPLPQNALLTDVDVTLVNTEGNNATLTVVETLVPQRRAAQALLFDLYSDYIFDVDQPARKFNVRKITDDKGNQLSFHHDRGTLLVGLAQPAAANAPVKLRYEIDGDFLYRPEGSNYWELGIEPWFPQLEWGEQAFTYHALLKVRKPFIAFTSGTTVRREAEGEWNVVETRVSKPVPWVAILAGRYQYGEETRNGVTVRVASFIYKNEQAWKKLRNIAFSAIETYPTFLGPFPFDEINILERNDYGWGQAPSGIVFITKEAFTPLQDEANDYVRGINLRLAHEIAHMYWGSTVRMGSPEEQWIDEAFAEYSAALFMKLAGRPNFYDQAFIEWRTGAKQAAKVTSIPMANRLVNPGDPYGNALNRQGLIYNKGAYLLAALHADLGDTQFLTFLKSYQKSLKGKVGTTDDVMGLLQFLTKKDYGPFFEQYYYGMDVPDVKKPGGK